MLPAFIVSVIFAVVRSQSTWTLQEAYEALRKEVEASGDEERLAWMLENQERVEEYLLDALTRTNRLQDVTSLAQQRLSNALDAAFSWGDDVKSDLYAAFVAGGEGLPPDLAKAIAAGVADDALNEEEDLRYEAPFWERWEDHRWPARREDERPRRPQQLVRGDVLATSRELEQLWRAALTRAGFTQDYVDSAVPDLLEHWWWKDERPRWETHSARAIQERRAYERLLELGYDEDFAVKNAEDPAFHHRPVDFPADAYAMMAGELQELLVAHGWPRAEAVRISDQLAYRRLAGYGGGRVSRGWWREAEAEPARQLGRARVQQALAGALGRWGLRDYTAAAKSLADAWAYEDWGLRA